MAEYSYLVLYLPRGTTRDAARRILADHAEYGRWELARVALNADGSRKATRRRPIIRPVRTPLASGLKVAIVPLACCRDCRHPSALPGPRTC